MYYNYKLQELADGLYRFIAIDVGAYGKQSDDEIFRQSSPYKQQQ
jgi:hypothetical protein